MWISKEEQKEIISSATRAGVNPKDLAKIRRSLRTAGISIIQEPRHGTYLGVKTANGRKLIWKEYVGLQRTL